MRRQYYRKLPIAHSQLDPRYIHSLPMHRFTHLGVEPMVDHLLHCENLRQETKELLIKMGCPKEMQNEAEFLPETDTAPEPDKDDRKTAEHLYRIDLKWFKYSNSTIESRYIGKSENAGTLKWIHEAQSIQWHWGPKATRGDVPLAYASRQDQNKSVENGDVNSDKKIGKFLEE